ncbi:hypothetical protein [Lactiplantibacillus argentoratensis]|uniref:hypothetical protein n=1 Tax=Lactiplantibacillus argentoratensis TaxID=271881 RepID=UPI003F53CE58
MLTVQKFPEVPELLVVDNGCEYNLEGKISSLNMLKKVNIVKNKENLGSAGGYHQVMDWEVVCNWWLADQGLKKEII